LCGVALLLVLFIVSSFITGCGSSSSSSSAKSQKNIVLKAADIQPEEYPTTMGLKYMAKLLDERTQGRKK
jgi:TRAP-type C4-dicarboxylate transport system substrate-binding protein